MADGDGPQDLVAGGVAVRVVEHLELVDVDHQDADRVAGPAALREQADVLVEVAPVRQPGQGVGRGAELRLAVRVGAGQRRRGLARRRRRGCAASPPATVRARRERTIAPMTPRSTSSGAASGSARPYDGADPPADPLGDPVGAERPCRPGPGSSRSAIGSRVTDSGTPVAGRDEPGLEDAGVGAAADDDDVVGAGCPPELLDDGVDDGVRRDGARQARQDPRERGGLLAAVARRAGRPPGRGRAAVTSAAMTEARG